MDTLSIIELIFGGVIATSIGWIFKRENNLNQDIRQLREKVVSIEKDTDKNRELLEQKIGHIEQSIVRVEALLNQLIKK